MDNNNSEYNGLIGKNIDLMFNGSVINSYKITEINPTTRITEDRGLLYKCPVEWNTEDDITKEFPFMDFESQTLDDLLEKNLAVCPFLPNMFFAITEQPF